MLPAANEPSHATRPTGAAELLARHARAAGIPVTVVFQVTDRCNYECVHCYETHDGAPELTFAEIERILDELADLGVLFLTLTGGEVFLRRDADDILRYARARRFAVKVKTTGHFIDDRRADLIAALGAIQIDLSCYAGTARHHDGITRTPGSWQRAIDAAQRLRARGVIVQLNALVMKANLDGLGQVKQLAQAMGCTFSFDPKVSSREDGAREPLAFRADDDALRGFYADPALDVMADVVRRHARRGGLDSRPVTATPCRAALETCGINPRGQVTACHALPMVVGDLRQQTFRDIWTGSAELEKIRALTWGKIEPCNQCAVRAYCQRCHAMALLEEGHIDGPSLEACRHAVIVRDLLLQAEVIPATETASPPTMRAAPTTGRRPLALRVLA